MNKELISIGLTSIGIIVLLFMVMPQIEGALGISTSPCDEYTNSTSSDIKYMWGKCYIPVYPGYETKEVCHGGILGIGQSCYESSETHYKSYKSYKCIIAETGEVC